ncbi:hypothetical protein GOBAR_DD08406 [Gossypium barbadense]|nr:hypothetical protein GOBAR_DD08406 [Gossypium barbadense]
MNDDLMVEFTAEGVQATVFSMPPLKASARKEEFIGADGLLYVSQNCKAVWVFEIYPDLLNARLGSYPFYTWRSLWSLRDLLEKGLGCRMGIGTSIFIWNDCWFLRPTGCKVQHIAVTTSVSWVSDLMVPGLYKWDEGRVHGFMGGSEVRWQPPVGPSVKVNFDASFQSHSRPSYSEALAFVRVVCFTTDLGFMHVIIEGDSLAVVKKGNRVARHLAAMGVARSVQGGGGAYCRH